jgi:RHS repeat-associated protein
MRHWAFLLAICAWYGAHAHDIKPANLILYKGGGARAVTVTNKAGENCTVLATLTSADPKVASVAASPLSGGDVAFQVNGLAIGTTTFHVTFLPAPQSTLCQTGGMMDIPVQVIDFQYAPGWTEATIGEPISAANGEIYNRFTDLSLGGPLPLMFARYYRSVLSDEGEVASTLGANWMHNFDVQLRIPQSYAIVTLFGGQSYRFAKSGTAWVLDSPAAIQNQLIQSGNSYSFLDLATRLTYVFNGASNFRLEQILDRNGNALTISYQGALISRVADGLGRTLDFNYASGRLVSVQDQTGRKVSFAYTSDVLTSFVDASGNTTNYTYLASPDLPAKLVSARMPRGNVPFSQSYSSNGQVIQQKDAAGNVTQITISGPTGATRTTTTTVTDPEAYTTVFVHQSRDLVKETDPNKASTSNTFDANDRALTAINRAGGTTSFTYHAPSGYLASWTKPDGATSSVTYTTTQGGRLNYHDVTSQTQPNGGVIKYQYDSNGNIAAVTDPLGFARTASYNSRGQVLTVTLPTGATVSFSYNADGTVAAIKSAAGNSTGFRYDPQKRISEIDYADGSSRSYQYDERDNIVRFVDERGNATSATFDANGLRSSYTDAAGRTATFAYDDDDRLVSASDRAGKRISVTYNRRSRPATITDQAGLTTALSYDSQNRVSSVTYPGGAQMRLTYDVNGALAALTNGLGNTTTFSHDTMRRLTGSKTPLGAAWGVSYTPLGAIDTITNPLGQTARFAYDRRGFRFSIAFSSGISTSFERNELGLIRAVTDPNGKVWSRGFDSMGRLISTTDPLGQTIGYGYDSRNRISSIAVPEGSGVFTYDAAGNPAQKTYSDGTALSYTFDKNNLLLTAGSLSLSYDANGRIASSNGIAMGRDDAGRITSVTYGPDKVVKYTYNQAGLLDSVQDWLGGSTVFAYDNARALTSMTRPNGVVTRYSRDADGRVTGIAEALGDMTLSSIALARDLSGRVVSEDRQTPLLPSPAPGANAFGYDAASQVQDYTYDGLGRLVVGGLRSYQWDLASRLTAYGGADGTASFTYDGLGMLTSRSMPAGAETFVLNYAFGLSSVMTVRADGVDAAYYVYLPSGALLHSIQADGGVRSFYHFDQTGSTVFLTDENGSVTDTYGITPYGESVTHAGASSNPFTWQGAYGVMQEGNTGLYYIRARWFDSSTGRFISRDALRDLDPRGFNPYIYARANPARYVDPTGFDYIDPTTGIIVPESGDGSPFYLQYPGPGNIGGMPLDMIDWAAWLHDDDYLRLNATGALDVINPFRTDLWWADWKLVIRALCAYDIYFGDWTSPYSYVHYLYGVLFSKIGIPVVFGTFGTLKAGVAAVETVGSTIIDAFQQAATTTTAAVTNLVNQPSVGFGANPVDTLTNALSDLTAPSNTGTPASPVSTISNAFSGVLNQPSTGTVTSPLTTLSNIFGNAR